MVLPKQCHFSGGRACQRGSRSRASQLKGKEKKKKKGKRRPEFHCYCSH